MSSLRKPLRPIQRITKPLLKFMHIESASGVVLLVTTALAIAAANSPWHESFAAFWNQKLSIGITDWTLSYPLWYWVNDGLMTVFFFLVGLEIKREIVLGELRDIRRIFSPVMAAVGGAVVPAIIYISLLQEQAGHEGWAIPMATDIAFVVGALALLGNRVPHGFKVFLLTLAIVDDIIAVLMIAVFYSSQLSMVWLAGAITGLLVIVGMNRLGIRTVIGYLLVGIVIWFCTLKSGIHPTISGVVLGLLTPALPLISRDKLQKDLELATIMLQKPNSSTTKTALKDVVGELKFINRESISPLERFETDVHPWAAFIIMPVFALANAGVPFSLSALGSPISFAVAIGLIIGKPVGIVLGLLLVVKTRLGIMPGGTNWGAVIGAGFLAGIGFTMSLFVASLSLNDQLLVDAKSGILAGSALSGTIGFIMLLLFLRSKSES